ncbi:MAG: UDP-3-O-acyl-N-acetylglucosamine deacetylase [Thiomargarita sp.]|nr:UDP-3-O-acyl-N-acetylglucosamine deacetylase [Thiomargarita sp.]
MMTQRTLKNKVSATGIGLHSGEKVRLTLKPAPINTGIIFKRVDLTVPVDIVAHARNVGDTRLSTTLVNGSVKISTVEHLLAALAGLGIDNAYIEVDASEIPIMDGSAGPFIYLIQSAGIEKQQAPKTYIRIIQAVQVKIDNKWARFDPFNGFKINLRIDFDHPVLKRNCQHIDIDFSQTTFVKEVSRARTFGFKHEFEFLRANNLALGGGLHNAIVIDDYHILNKGGLRYEDEFVRHKVLDAVGDLFLIGSGIIGAFSGYQSGHELNNKLLHALLDNQAAWEKISSDERITAPSLRYLQTITVS